MRVAVITACVGMALIVAGAACRPAEGTPEAAAEAFIDAHYVRIDLHASLQAAEGLAAEKVREEIRLTEGVEAPEAGAKPRIHYALDRRREEHGEVRFVYKLTISPAGSESFTRDVMLTVRDEGRGFRVTNYAER